MRKYISVKSFTNKFYKDTQGVAAVEAALLTPVFVTLLIGVLELLFFIFNSNSFDNAVRNAVQDLRLGKSEAIAAQNNWTAEEYYRHSICEKVYFNDCYDHIQISLEKREVGRWFSETTITDVSGTFVDPSTVILLRATTRAPGIGFLASFADAEFLNMTAAQIFITEPF